MSTAAAFDAVSPWGSGTRLAEQTRCSVAPWTAKEPYTAQAAPSNPAVNRFTCLGCGTASSVEATISVLGSPTRSGTRRPSSMAPGSARAFSRTGATRRGEADDPGERVREEPLGVAQEGTLALHAAELQESRGQEPGAREPFESFAASRADRIEGAVGVVGEAEEPDHGVFRLSEAWGRARPGHRMHLVVGRMTPVLLLPIHATLTQLLSSSAAKRASSQR